MKKLFCLLAIVLLAATACAPQPAQLDGNTGGTVRMLSDEFDLTADAPAPNMISPDSSVDMSGLNLFWQAENLQFAADADATLSIYTFASKNDDGEFSFDDGQDWLVLMETSLGDYPLFPRGFVQLGRVSCAAFNDAAGNFHVLTTVSQTADYRIYDCVFDNARREFQVVPVYEAAGINFVTASP